MWWQTLIGVFAGLLLLWLTLIALLWRVRRRTSTRWTINEALRLIPDTVRLLRRLAADPGVPRGVRIRLAALLAYLVAPIDIVPDFVPVLGYADDAIIVTLALRSVIRHAGLPALERHWPGTREGLAALTRLAGHPRRN